MDKLTDRKMKAIDLNKTKQREFTLDKAGSYLFYFTNLSGQLDFKIAAAGVKCQIYGWYNNKEQAKFSLETVQEHLAPNSYSNLLIHGLWQEAGEFDYNGLIKVSDKAAKSEAHLKIKNLVLNDKVQIKAQPWLDINNNEVKSSHGVSIGQLDKKELEFMQSRGLSIEQGRKLLIKGFKNDLLSNYASLITNQKV